MAIVLSGTGIDMGGNPVSNASQVDSVLMNENGLGVATETQVGTANSALVKTALNATGDAPIYACRAWVNFNGTGTVAIRGSGNVSSITDSGAGNYTVNFTTAMPNDSYATLKTSGLVAGAGGFATDTPQTTTAVRVGTFTAAGAMADSPNVSVAVFC